MQGHEKGSHDLAPGIRGALVTCDVHLERDAIKETYRLFDALLDAAALAPTESKAADAAASSTNTAGDALAAELQALQEESAGSGETNKNKSIPRLSIAQTGCNGTVFVRVTSDAALLPVPLVDRVMENALAGATGSRAPHVVRMLPVQATCSARTAESIAAAAAPLLAAALTGYTGTYAVVWRRRCNNEIDKKAVIDALASAVQQVAPKATVDLTNAKAAIVAEVIKTTCTLAVLPRWGEFQGYNLRAVCGGGDGDGKATKAGQQSGSKDGASGV